MKSVILNLIPPVLVCTFGLWVLHYAIIQHPERAYRPSTVSSCSCQSCICKSQ